MRRLANLVLACALTVCASGWTSAQSPPGEVTNLQFVDDNTLAWQPMSIQIRFNVYRGVAPQALDLGCLAHRIRPSTVKDFQKPPLLFTYLVAAENVFGQGPLGPSGTNRVVTIPCGDADADGIQDGIDNCRGLSNPTQADYDNDLIGDACDTCTDTDHDGFENPGFPASTCPPDNCVNAPNPDQGDADGDGSGNACDICTDTDGDGRGNPGYPVNTCPTDNCPTVSNPTQANFDGDGLGDVCDTCTDTDSDGFGNSGFPANTCATDNCPSTSNPTQANFDGDALGDACDACTDTDADGYGNPGYPANTCAVDNCPTTANTTQTNLDGDGFGDACDSCTDSDADGFGNPGYPANTCPNDNCPSTPNPTQADVDADGTGDACETCIDSDGDGFGDPSAPGNTCPDDNCPAVPNPTQANLDGDGSGDACDTCTDGDGDGFGNPGFAANTCPVDNCPLASNPTQANLDGDGSGDACDTCTDGDGDGFGNPGFAANTCPVDNCPETANPDQLDADFDGTGDACEGCVDSDGDGFGDPNVPTNGCPDDNCPVVPNPTQSDADGDGSGDLCDLCTDIDGDGYGDQTFASSTCPADNCPGLPNAAQTDQNADGSGDACDPRTYDFESDPLGSRPQGMTQEGGWNGSFLVRQYSGPDRGVAYDGGVAGMHDLFDRAPSGARQHDTTVFVDAVELTGESATLELWSDGTEAERAGSGLQLRYESNGTLSARLRRADSYEPLGSASVGSRAHLRLRLVKGAGVQSTLFVDTLSGATWTQVASFAIPDDSDLYGRQLALANLSGGRLPVLRLTGVSTVPAANLTLRRSLDRLDAWKLFQRGPAGTAPIPVPFSYRSPVASRLEVRIVARANGLPLPGFDFANWRFDLAPAPNGAEAEVTITGVPGGGNYDLEARLVEIGSGFVRGTDLVTQIAVGDVFLAAGQSNMSGYAGALEPREPAIDEVHLFGNDYRWRQAAEPIDSGVDERDLVSQDTREEHSLMLRFAKEVRAAVGVPIAILPAARGGTSLQADWQRDSGDPESRFTLYGSAIHRVRAQGYQHPIRGVIWYQGEQDVGLGTDEYLADLQALVANLRTDLANPSLFFGNCQLATREGTVLSVWLEIQEAQRRLALLDPLSSVIATVDLARADFVHLNIDSYKTAGTRLARSVVHGSYGIAQNRGPKLLSASFDGMDRSRVKLTYDENVTGGSSFLYEVLSDSVPVSVVSASASGTVVTLQLAAPANGTSVSVSYGFSEFPAAPWVVATDGSGAALTFKGLPVN